MEEDTTPPRRNDTLLLGGMRATRSSSMRLPNLKGVRRSRPSHLVDRPVHPLHLHTLRGSPRMASSSCRWRRRRNSLVLRRGLWQMSISTIKLSTHWVLARTYIVGAPWTGAILQRGVGKYPQGVCLGNFDDYGAYP
jgi:hypothetical protein